MLINAKCDIGQVNKAPFCYGLNKVIKGNMLYLPLMAGKIMPDFVTSLPFLLGLALFVAIVFFARLLLSPENVLERRERRDRRMNQKMPAMPFYDKNRELVTEDRRNKDDRRKRSFVITTTQKRIH